MQTTSSVSRFIRYSLRLRRVEYRVAELPIYVIPALLSSGSLTILSTPRFWEGLVVFLFMFSFGDLVNCLEDRELDSVYKPHLTEAVYGLGIPGVKAQIWFSLVSGLFLTGYLAAQRGQWILLPFVGFGYVFAYAYSAPPLRLKGRGVFQLVFYWLGLFVGPMIFSALVCSGSIPDSVVAVAITYGLLQTGGLLLNTAEDLPEDRESGVRTVIVALGLRRSLTIAAILIICGGSGLLLAFITNFTTAAPSSLLLAALLFLVSVVTITSICVLRLRWKVSNCPEEEAMRHVRKVAKYTPVFITLNALASLAVSIPY